MYSRSFDGISDNGTAYNTVRSEGQLYNMQREMAESEKPVESEKTAESSPASKPFGRAGRLFGSFEADDLILIAIGILILLDGDCDNDVLILFVLALLFL